MAGLKERLEAAGYDTSGLDEQALLGKLDKAGYDTSALGSSAPKEPGFVDTVKNQVMQNLGPMGLAGKAEDVIQGVANKAGDYIEQGLQKGVQMSANAPTVQASPGVAKAAGTLAKITPAVVQATMPVGEAAQATKESAIVKAVTPGAKAKVGAAIGAAEKAAGVKPIIPTVGNMAKRFGLKPGEKGFADVVNHVTENVEKLSPQDLSDFRDLVRTQFGLQKVAKGTRLEALTSAANKVAGEALNKSVEGRAALAAEYAKISKIQKVLKQLGITLGSTGAAGAAYKLFKG